MKKLHLSLALSAVAPFAWAQVAETNTVVPKENGSGRHHDPGKEVVYVTRSGKVLDADAMRAKIKWVFLSSSFRWNRESHVR